MDFSLITLFIPTNGTLASSGSTQNLTPGQLGLFGPDYAIVNSGNIAGKPYIYIAEGRLEVVPGLGTKRSDKIGSTKIIDWYKVAAVQNAATQITQIGSWSIQCDQTLTITFVLHSSYIDTGFFNGMEKSVTVKTPCCSCGANPCASITGAALDTVIDQAVAKINQVTYGVQPVTPMGSDLSRFIVASRVGSSATGGNPLLVVTEKPLDVYGNPCEFDAYPWEYDRMWFRTFVINGPFTSQDLMVYDSCNIAGVATINQRSTYQTGTSAEIAQLEKNYYSYQASHFKSLYKNAAWNMAFASNVAANTFYDTYYIKYFAYDDYQTDWNQAIPMSQEVIIAFPIGTGGTFETAMVAYLGAVTDWSATNLTTTTTTSTTSTSTSSTTTLMP